MPVSIPASMLVRVCVVAAAFYGLFVPAAAALTPTPTPTVTPCSVGTTCEAESVARGGGVVGSTLHAGYTGSGFADYVGTGAGYVEWTVSVPAAGVYALSFRYANGGTGDRPMSITANGVSVATSLSFPVTGWTNWTLRSVAATLPAGLVRIRAAELPNGPNVDSLTVVSTACGIGAVCEAENAARGGGVLVSTQHAGFTGTGFADYIGTGSGYVEWTVSVPTTGAYALSFRYANGGAGDRPMSISANGTTVSSSLSFPVTGWTAWTVKSVNATLPAGTVKIRATELPNGPNVDSLTVTVVNPTPMPTSWATGYMKITVSKVDPKVGETVTVTVSGNTGLGSFNLQLEGDDVFAESPAPSPAGGTSWSWTLTADQPGTVRFRASVYGETQNGCSSCFVWRTVSASASEVTVKPAASPTPTPGPQGFVSNTVWYNYTQDVLVRADTNAGAYAPTWSIKVIDVATGLEQNPANPIVTFKAQGPAVPPSSTALQWWTFTPVRAGSVQFQTTVNAEYSCGPSCYMYKTVTATSWPQSVSVP